MFALPSKGFYRSVRVHRVNLPILCDWVEASALFGDGEVAGPDVVDFLRENEVYESQDFAWEIVNSAFATIRERMRVLGRGYPFRIQGGNRVVSRGDWRDFSPYSFCLTLSLCQAYPDWWRAFGPDYVRQGELFEALTAESIAATFPGWEVHPTGWSATNPNSLAPIVRNVAALLGEATGDIGRWTAQRAKEAGLDILCFRPFVDDRGGLPVFMFQCASGSDWIRKLNAPEMRIWTKVITFASDPKKAFAMPFALEDADFTRHCNVVNGLFLDRDRLLAPGCANQAWVSLSLANNLSQWIAPRLGTLPTAY